MEKPKPWQIGVIALAVVAAGVSLVLSILRDDSPRMTHRVLLVDVQTGDLFEINTARFQAVLPEINPETGSATLLPVGQEPDGKYRIEARYLDSLPPDVETPAIVDGAVNVRGQPKKFTRK